jgi:hypothetical protein
VRLQVVLVRGEPVLAGVGQALGDRPVQPSPSRRARTASRTVAGTGSSGLASTSVTKNGLPPVAPSTAAGSSPAGADSSRTPAADSRASSRRHTSWPARAPRTRQRGWSSRSSSSR